MDVLNLLKARKKHRKSKSQPKQGEQKGPEVNDKTVAEAEPIIVESKEEKSGGEAQSKKPIINSPAGGNVPTKAYADAAKTAASNSS